jgi:hypothetical protein
MNTKTTIIIVSLSMLISLSVSAAGRPSVGANAKRITTLEGQTSQLETDLANIALTPGPLGADGSNGAPGPNGLAGAKGSDGKNGADGMMYDGAFEGDMQYWNGNAWIMITAPAVDTTSLSFCDGKPTWTQGGCPPVFHSLAPIGVELKSRSHASAGMFAGKWRWRVDIVATSVNPTGRFEAGVGLVVLGDNGQSFTIAGVQHWSWNGDSLYIFPTEFLQGDVDYSVLLAMWNSKFPVGTTLSIGQYQ